MMQMITRGAAVVVVEEIATTREAKAVIVSLSAILVAAIVIPTIVSATCVFVRWCHQLHLLLLAVLGLQLLLLLRLLAETSAATTTHSVEDHPADLVVHLLPAVA